MTYINENNEMMKKPKITVKNLYKKVSVPVFK
jgi:hypothetical protein